MTEYATDSADVEKAIGNVRGLSKRSRRKLAECMVDTLCAHCRARVPVETRTVRKIAGEHFVFHDKCASRGLAAPQRQQRPAVSVVRVPARAMTPQERLRDAKAMLLDAKTRYV